MAWFRSRDGAVALALLALVVFVVRAFLDWRYVFGDQFSDQSATVVALVVYGLFVGLWSWLLSAARGERRGIIALLVLTLLLGSSRAWRPSSPSVRSRAARPGG